MVEIILDYTDGDKQAIVDDWNSALEIIGLELEQTGIETGLPIFEDSAISRNPIGAFCRLAASLSIRFLHPV